MIRFPLPYKVGEGHFPGNSDEKARVEAATYIWLRDNCPAVPVPKLLGFGFTNGMIMSVFFFLFMWWTFFELR